MIRRLAAALAAIFLLVASRARCRTTLEDIDSINFALGVESFDVAAHRPHPPGYPVFMAMAKASTAARRRRGAVDGTATGARPWGSRSGA